MWCVSVYMCTHAGTHVLWCTCGTNKASFEELVLCFHLVGAGPLLSAILCTMPSKLACVPPADLALTVSISLDAEISFRYQIWLSMGHGD